ncbi:MAG: hypothetical protein WC375_08785 [Methanomassiliicoccales archaeon]
MTEEELVPIPQVHKPFCYHGNGLTSCKNKLATKEHCESCRTCPLRPEGM